MHLTTNPNLNMLITGHSHYLQKVFDFNHIQKWLVLLFSSAEIINQGNKLNVAENKQCNFTYGYYDYDICHMIFIILWYKELFVVFDIAVHITVKKNLFIIRSVYIRVYSYTDVFFK